MGLLRNESLKGWGEGLQILNFGLYKLRDSRVIFLPS